MKNMIEAKTNNEILFGIKKKSGNPYVALSENEFMDRLETSCMHAKQGYYRDADDAIEKMRNRYRF